MVFIKKILDVVYDRLIWPNAPFWGLLHARYKFIKILAFYAKHWVAA